MAKGNQILSEVVILAVSAAIIGFVVAISIGWY